MRDAVIVAAARTPIGRAYKGAFNATPGPTLGALSRYTAGQVYWYGPAYAPASDGARFAADLERDLTRPTGFEAVMRVRATKGVSIANFLRAALKARLPKGEDIDAVKFYKQLYARMDQLEMDRSFPSRSVNEGFSGGEKKRNEILQLMMLEPKYAILDETETFGITVENFAKIIATLAPNAFQKATQNLETNLLQWIRENQTTGLRTAGLDAA
jgi:ABC-type dipeptide/oligopeptide/nickel transport system ATPase subunit